MRNIFGLREKNIFSSYNKMDLNQKTAKKKKKNEMVDVQRKQTLKKQILLQ